MEKHKKSFNEWLEDSKYFRFVNLGYADYGYNFHSKKQVSQEYKEYLQSHK